MKKNRFATISPTSICGNLRDRSPEHDALASIDCSDLVGIACVGVGVAAIVIDDRGRIFMAQRGPLARNERQKWEFPGGAVQLHETLRDAVRREFEEEFGMIIDPVKILCVADNILATEKQHWVSICFVARHLSGEPRVREVGKCVSIRWCEQPNIPKPLAASSEIFLKTYGSSFGSLALASSGVQY